MGFNAATRLRQLCLTLGATLGLLILIEAGLRLFDYDPIPHATSSAKRLLIPLPGARKYGFRPGFRGRVWGTAVRINSAGFRGTEPDPGRHPRRVVVLGDAVAFGLFVAEAQTFPAQLGKALSIQGRRVEVLNLAVAGYGPLQKVAALEEVGIPYRPRAVVLQITLNDAEVASPSLDYLHRIHLHRRSWVRYFKILQGITAITYKHKIEDHHAWANSPEVFRATFAGQIAPVGPGETALREKMQRVRDHLAPEAIPARYYGDPDRVGRLRYALDRLRELSRAHRFEVIAVMMPLLDQADGRYPFAEAHAVIAHEVRRCGFGLIDMTNEYLKVGMSSIRVHRKDNVHPNTRGHLLIARALALELGPVLARAPTSSPGPP